MSAVIDGLLNAGHQVKVLAINTNKYFVKPDQVPDDYRNKTNLEMVYIDLSIKPLPAFFNLFTNKSYHVERFITKQFEQKLITIVRNEEFDIIQLELLYLAPYLKTIRKLSNAKIILRAHNKRCGRRTSRPLRYSSTTLDQHQASQYRWDGYHISWPHRSLSLRFHPYKRCRNLCTR